MKTRFLIVWALLLGVHCGGSQKVAQSSTKRSSVSKATRIAAKRPVRTKVAKPAFPSVAMQAPPPSGTAKPSPFPKVVHATLPNGFALETVEVHTLPVVEVRLVVGAGAGYGRPGVAALTADMLKEGGTRTMTNAVLAERVETLGSNLEISTGFDSTVLSMHVVRDQLNEALKLLSEVVRSPKFDEKEFAKRKAQATDEAVGRTRSNSGWMTGRILAQEMFDGKSPYATSLGATPSEISEISLKSVREFHKGFYVPKNIALVVAGDVDQQAVVTLVQNTFGSWQGGEPPIIAPVITRKPPMPRRIFVAHRPKSAQSDILVANFAPERKQPYFPAIRVATGVLGTGPASRLFLDVREQRSLAYAAYATILDMARGPGVLRVAVSTQTPKTGPSVQAILENLDRLSTQSMTAQEVETMRRYLSDTFALHMETIGSIADLVVEMRKLGLPEGYWDAYRSALLEVDAPGASVHASALFKPESFWIAVAGDADYIAAPLSRFGEVTVLDPENEFKVIRTLPNNPSAPLERTSR